MPSKNSSQVERICEQCGSSFLIAYRYTIRRDGRFCPHCIGQNPSTRRNNTKKTPLYERFHRYLGIKNSSGCIEWTGTKNNKGYGMIGEGSPSRKTLLAHRVSYELANGPIPDGIHCLHKCDNPKCVNHEHLFLGTQKDNSNDMVAKGRCRVPGLSGENHPMAKLSNKDVEKIKILYSIGNTTMREIAGKFGVTRSMIGKIISGRNRKV